MKRKEQIQDAAADYRDGVCCGFYDPVADARQDSFICGAEWADEHPKSDIVNKQKFIKKTWQWLKAHIKIETLTFSDVWDTSIVDILATDFTTVDEMEESFRKIMEE